MTIIDALGEPYPGLRPFRRDETHIFFGRENTIDDMIERLAAHRFLAVTGASGSGKSSLVRTGLLDALDRGLLVEAGSVWKVAEFRPGGEPFVRLAKAILAATGATPSAETRALTEAKLACGPLGLVQLLDEIEAPARSNVLLLVDQFEEIFRFRQGRASDEVDAFVALLLSSARQTKRPIYVVITMRSDFLGECAQFTNLAETINDGQFLTPRLTRDQCRQAIEEPARVYGGCVEQSLVTRLLGDMGGNPDQLPLLQHALMLLWQRARGRAGSDPPLLTLADYESLGGIGTRRSPDTAAPAESQASNGALSDHADRVLAGLTDEQQRLAEILFRALTESDGAGARDVRRPISLAKAAAIAGVPVDTLTPVIEAFRAPGVTFLTPLLPDTLGPETIIDISHESLIRQWVTLRKWARDEYQAAERYRDIERRAKRWKDGLGNLLTKLDLAVALERRKVERPNAAWAERYGGAFDLTTEFLRKSEQYRFWRRALASVAICIPLVLIAGAAWLMFYEITLMQSALPYMNPAGEFSNYNVPPQAVLKQEEIGSETPVTIPGGKVINTLDVKTALESGKIGGVPFILVDAWNSDHDTMPNAERIRFAGFPGHFQDGFQHQLEEKLKALTGNKLDMPIVFFCVGSNCWESYNAALRAIHLGYSNVYWYRGGLQAWKATTGASVKLTVDAMQRVISSVPVDSSAVVSNIPDIVAIIENRILQSTGANRGIQGDVKDWHFFYQRGLTNEGEAKHDEAIADFSKAIARNPENADCYYARGRAYANRDDFGDALTDLLKAADLDPAKNTEVQAILLDPKYASAYDQRGNDNYREADYEHAIEDYSRAIQINPEYISAYTDRGRVYLRKRDFDHAMADFDAAIKIDSRYVSAYLFRGNGYYAKGDYDAAIRDYDQAIQLNPKEGAAYGRRGSAYYAKGDYDRAIWDYDQAIQLDPEDAAAHSGRANVYGAKGDYNRAIGAYDQAIRLDSKDAAAHRGRGRAYFYQGNFKSAAAALLHANELGNDAYSLIWLYLSRERAGENGAAELAAIAAHLKSMEWPRPVIKLYLGERSPAEVLSVASNADERCEAQFYGGEWHILRGNRAEAVAALQAAVDTCPKNFFEYVGALAELKRLNSGIDVPGK